MTFKKYNKDEFYEESEQTNSLNSDSNSNIEQQKISLTASIKMMENHNNIELEKINEWLFQIFFIQIKWISN